MSVYKLGQELPTIARDGTRSRLDVYALSTRPEDILQETGKTPANRLGYHKLMTFEWEKIRPQAARRKLPASKIEVGCLALHTKYDV